MASWLRLVAADPACGGGDARPVVAVADRLGVVSRIALSADAWDTRLQRVMTIDHRVGWTGASESHTRLLGCDSSHLDLLVISPTPPRFWPTSLAMAAGHDVSPNQRGGVLATYAPIAPRRVPRRAEPEQVSRWETDGGRIRQLTKPCSARRGRGPRLTLSPLGRGRLRCGAPGVAAMACVAPASRAEAANITGECRRPSV
jgi:hypothetical protein